MASFQQGDGKKGMVQKETMLEGLRDAFRNTKILSGKTTVPFVTTQLSSGFAALDTKDEESCWAKAARKNRDKGYKTWRTFNILQPLYDPNTRIIKPQVLPPQFQAPPQKQSKKPTKKPTKKQLEKQLKQRQAWLKGLQEAEDKFGHINGLSKPDDMDIMMTALAAQQNVTLKGTVEEAGEFYEWEGQEGEGGWKGKDGAWEWQGAGGLWEDVPESAAQEWRETCDDQDPFLNK